MGHEVVIQILVDAGADVINKATDDGQTPLYVAAEGCHHAIVQAITEVGAEEAAEKIARALVGTEDVNKAIEKGFTPMYKPLKRAAKRWCVC